MERTSPCIDGKHFSILKRTLEKGGRQDIFLGTRDCQAYVEPCEFGEGEGVYDETPDIPFGLMFHSFSYPDETGVDELHSNFWQATMKKGVLEFPRPEHCEVSRFVRDMSSKEFGIGNNLLAVEDEEAQL